VYSSAHGNFRGVVPGKVYRSAQPSPEQLREWTGRYGFKTVINLRGDETEEVKAERAVAEDLGLKMVTMTLSSYRLSARYLIVELLKTLESVETPVLIHCHSGIDRAGTASALAAMVIGQVHYEKAKWQAYVAPGPWKRKKYKNRRYFRDYSHISDVLRLYERHCGKNNLQNQRLATIKAMDRRKRTSCPRLSPDRMRVCRPYNPWQSALPTERSEERCVFRQRN